MWSVPRLYNQEQLRLRQNRETAVRRVRGRCETVAGLRRREPIRRGTSTCEDLVRAVVNCSVLISDSAIITCSYDL
jgi:hypothetical protein